MELVLKGHLGNLRVLDLNKYLTKHNLKTKGKKAEKINAITADVLRRNKTNVIESVLKRVEPPEEEVEDTEEEIESDSTSNPGSDEENDTSTDGPLSLVVRTRYGRYAGHWNLFRLT